jgi:SagB-type dehydrogenase family enzyme
MTRIRRTPYAFFYLEDDYVFDLASLFNGETPPPAAEARVLALAMLTGERHPLSRQDLEVLLSVPAERWVDDDGRDRETRRGLIEKGLLLSDAEGELLTRLREHDERLSAGEWNLYAALYHFMTKWSTVLRYVFGCHGYAQVVPGVVWIKRTSPSGGALHPIEAYPIVSNVEGVEPGIYHYSARDHSLVLLSPLDRDEAQRTATSFMGGQSYFGAAPVSFVLTARFARTHWKYRRHHKAYAGILMDAAHLSQTLYLVSGELGLGAFVTIAINARDMEERLGLDGVSEGAIAMTGCGPRAPGDSPLELQISPVPPT